MTEEIVRSLLRKHGLTADSVERSPHEGVANAVFLAGSWVVRINKDLDYEGDSFTEAQAAPAAWSAGVKTPRMAAFDNDRDVVDRAVSIFERAKGRPWGAGEATGAAFFRALGEEIGRWHRGVARGSLREDVLDPAWEINAVEVAVGLSSAGLPLESEEARSLAGALEPLPWVFSHQDLHPWNILAEEGRLTAVLDWGDAGWASPAVDFRFVPEEWLDEALAGYGEDTPNLRAWIALHRLDQKLYLATRSGTRTGSGNRVS